jgi:hypothetical protein
MLMDWFEKAREFKRVASDKLTSTEFLELEHYEISNGSNLPENVAIHPIEIPGIYKVQDEYRGDSGFEYFMDGVQKTILWQHYNYSGTQVPVFLHFSGAVIVKRVRADRFIPFDSLYRSAILVPTFLYEEWEGDGLEDTGSERCWDLNEIRSKARIKSRALRQEIEQELMHRFLSSKEAEESLLIKDGSIFGTMKASPVIGLIKTHQTLYLQRSYPHIQQMVWSMPEFYRSMNFSIQLIERSQTLSHKVNSFYLRTHEPTYPEMGLVRVEYNDSSLPPDEISSWLIAERWVRASCSRWDRQIYPVQVCEDYLRTQLPRSHHIRVILQSF